MCLNAVVATRGQTRQDTLHRYCTSKHQTATPSKEFQPQTVGEHDHWGTVPVVGTRAPVFAPSTAQSVVRKIRDMWFFRTELPYPLSCWHCNTYWSLAQETRRLYGRHLGRGRRTGRGWPWPWTLFNAALRPGIANGRSSADPKVSRVPDLGAVGTLTSQWDDDICQ